MLVLFSPLDPSQCNLLKNIAQAMFPTLLYQHSCSWMILSACKHVLISKKKQNIKVACPRVPLAINSLLCSSLHKTPQKNSLYIPHPILFPFLFYSFWKLLSQDLFKYCSVLFSLFSFPFLFLWTPVICMLDLSTMSHRALHFFSLFQYADSHDSPFS